MPYIEKKERKPLDPLIDKLAERIVLQARNQTSEGALAGLLNYACTRLALKVVKRRFGKIRYWIIALIGGVFKNIADEFYRRIGEPYENRKIKESGDVDEYKEFTGEIKSKS